MPGDDDYEDEKGKEHANGGASLLNKKKKKRRDTVTIITEDRDWGNRGQGKPVLLQHGHHLDS